MSWISYNDIVYFTYRRNKYLFTDRKKKYNFALEVNENSAQIDNLILVKSNISWPLKYAQYIKYFGQPICPLILRKAKDHKNNYNVTDYLCVENYKLANLAKCQFINYIVGAIFPFNIEISLVFERFPNIIFIIDHKGELHQRNETNYDNLITFTDLPEKEDIFDLVIRIRQNKHGQNIKSARK